MHQCVCIYECTYRTSPAKQVITCGICIGMGMGMGILIGIGIYTDKFARTRTNILIYIHM